MKEVKELDDELNTIMDITNELIKMQDKALRFSSEEFVNKIVGSSDFDALKVRRLNEVIVDLRGKFRTIDSYVKSIQQCVKRIKRGLK